VAATFKQIFYMSSTIRGSCLTSFKVYQQRDKEQAIHHRNQCMNRRKQQVPKSVFCTKYSVAYHCSKSLSILNWLVQTRVLNKSWS